MPDQTPAWAAWAAGYAEGRKPHEADAFGLIEIKVPWRGYTKKTRAEFCDGWRAGRKDAAASLLASGEPPPAIERRRGQ